MGSKICLIAIIAIIATSSKFVDLATIGESETMPASANTDVKPSSDTSVPEENTNEPVKTSSPPSSSSPAEDLQDSDEFQVPKQKPETIGDALTAVSAKEEIVLRIPESSASQAHKIDTSSLPTKDVTAKVETTKEKLPSTTVDNEMQPASENFVISRDDDRESNISPSPVSEPSNAGQVQDQADDRKVM